MTNQTPQSTFDEKLDEIIEYFVQERDAGFDKIHQRFLKGEITIEQQVQLSEIDWDKHISEAKAAITSLVLEEVNKAELSDYATFKWLLKDALQPSSDTRKMSRIYLVQELVDKDYDSLAAQQRSIITKELK